MNLYDPQKPFWKYRNRADCHPLSFGSLGEGQQRPRAMIRGPSRMIYVGSHPPYGQLGGAIAACDPTQNKVSANYRNLVLTLGCKGTGNSSPSLPFAHTPHEN